MKTAFDYSRQVAQRLLFVLEAGRIWGTWNGHLLPVRWETVKVGLKDAYIIRRVYRRLAGKGTGSLRHLTVFVRCHNVLRLLEFLGYRVE